MITKEQSKEISDLYSQAIIKNDEGAMAQFKERIVDHFCDYANALDKEQKRAEDYLEETGEVVTVCEDCGNPMVWTFVFPYQEYYCLHCGTGGGMLGREQAEATPELRFRHWMLKAIWKGLTKQGGLLTKGRYKLEGCPECWRSDKDETHNQHLSEKEIAANEIAQRYLNMLVGRFPLGDYQQLRHEATAALGFLQEWEASDFEAADESVQSSFHMTVEGLKRALLQSEKGGEA